MFLAANRLRRHADYQRVYRSSRKTFARQMSYFFLLRDAALSQSDPKSPNHQDQALPHAAAPRIGLTVGRVLGKAVDRNRIKRRMRAAVRSQIGLLSAPVDVVLHPQRRVAEIDFSLLNDEVRQIFRAIQRSAERQLAKNGTGEQS